MLPINNKTANAAVTSSNVIKWESVKNYQYYQTGFTDNDSWGKPLTLSNMSDPVDTIGVCKFDADTATAEGSKITPGNKTYVVNYVHFKATITVPAYTEYTVNFFETMYINAISPGSTTAAWADFYSYGEVDQSTSVQFGHLIEKPVVQSGYIIPSGVTRIHNDSYSSSTGSKEEFDTKLAYTGTFKNNAYVKGNPNGERYFIVYFGFFAGTTAGSVNVFNFNSTAKMSTEITAMATTPPTVDKTSVDYDASGNTFTFNYNPSSVSYIVADKDGNDITSSCTISTDGTCKLTNVGEYTFTFALNDKSLFVWSSGGTDDKTCTLTINKAEPNVICTFADASLENKDKFLIKDYSTLPEIINSHANATPGTIAWDSGQTPSKTKSEYGWTFTPTDTLNYKTVTDTKTIPFADADARGIHVYVKEGATIYDRYDTVTYSSLNDYLKSCLTVKVFYEDDSESSPLAISSYNVTTTNITVTDGDSQEKTISVRVTSTDETNGLLGSVSATVIKAVIQSMSVEQKADATNLVYPVTLDDIKNNYDVYLGWNFSARELKTDASKITVALADGEELKAGTVNFIFTFTDGDLTKTSDPVEVTINKGTYPDADKITFDNKTVSLGGEHSIAVENLPDGVTVKYVYDGNETDEPPVFSELNNDGYEITAKFTHTNPNYEDIADITAKLIITDKEIYDKSELTVKGDGLTVEDNKISATYSGEAFVFAPDGKVKDNNGVEVTSDYTVDYEIKLDNEVVTEIKNAGTYTVTVTYTMPTDGDYADYEPSFEVKYTFTVNKADFDIKSIVSFNDKAVEYDGEAHSIVIEGELPDWITVTYLGNGGSDIGIYLATAFFSHDNPNYNAIGNMTATLTIKEGSPVIPPEEGGDDGSSNNMFLYIGIGVGALLLLGLLLFLLLRRKRADGYDDDYDDEYDYDDDDDDDDDEDDDYDDDYDE